MLESKVLPAPWSRIHVVRGAEPRGVLLRPEQPMLLMVGSDPAAKFCIPYPSVAPRQLDALWDGCSLWLEDRLRLGRTFVNGRLLNEWVRVRGEVIVSFGALRLWMAAGGGAPAPERPDFEAVERASQPELEVDEGRADRRSQTGRFPAFNAAGDLLA